MDSENNNDKDNNKVYKNLQFETHLSSIPTKITNNIFLGPMESAENKEILINLGITHIIVAGQYLLENFPDVIIDLLLLLYISHSSILLYH